MAACSFTVTAPQINSVSKNVFSSKIIEMKIRDFFLLTHSKLSSEIFFLLSSSAWKIN